MELKNWKLKPKTSISTASTIQIRMPKMLFAGLALPAEEGDPNGTCAVA